MLRSAGGLAVTQTTEFAGYYGAFYSSELQSDGADTPLIMWCENTFDSNGVTMESDGTKDTQITFAHAGTYNIQFSTVFSYTGGGGNGKQVDVWFSQNGTAIPNSNTRLDVTSSAPYVVASWNFLKSVAAGDYIQLVWQTDNANIKAVNIAASGAIPETPSVIITVTQVSQPLA